MQFDDEHDIGDRSGHHSTPITDRDEIIKELCTTKVLDQVPDCIPRTSFRSNIMKRVDKAELIQWMSEKIPINRTNSYFYFLNLITKSCSTFPTNALGGAYVTTFTCIQ